MKALIRGKNETVTEDMGIVGIDWTTGAPLTNAAWYGGSYTLVGNYTAPTETEEETYEITETVAEETVTETEETVTINGVTYTKSQLRALLGE